MKIKTQLTTVEDVEIEIEFPAYFKKTNHNAKVFFKDELSKGLSIWEEILHINPTNTIEHFDLSDYTQTTKEEFETAFNNTIENLKNIL